jgi:pilus assembly protein CpaB
MMKQRGLLLVALSLIMGIGAAWFAKGWIDNRAGLSADDSNNIIVMAAAIDIPYGTKLESRHIKAVKIPKDIKPQDAVLTVDEIEGFVANSDVLAGEMLIKSRFAAHGVGSTLAALIGKDMRAITVRVDDVVGVGGFLLPGNYVDVLATKVDRKTKIANSETILKKMKVLAVDQTARSNDTDPVVVRAVTLEMTAKDSEVLAKRRAEGTIQLTLRNPNDDVIMAKEAAPVVAKKRVYRAPAPTVTIIRGTQVKKQKTRS